VCVPKHRVALDRLPLYGKLPMLVSFARLNLGMICSFTLVPALLARFSYSADTLPMKLQLRTLSDL